MPDEIPIRTEAQDPDNYGGDPEVPRIPHPGEASHKAHNSNAEAHHATKYVQRTFHAIRMVLFWIWSHVPHKVPWGAIATVSATVIMASATCVLTYYARKQWKVIGDQLYEIGENVKDERTAQWAHVDILQQVQVRIMVENGKVTFWTPGITMVNNGNTGTYNTLEVISIFVSKTEMSESCDLPDNGKPQHSDIGPHEAELFDAQPIPIAAIRSIQNSGHVYIYGRAVYRDVFQFYGHIKHGQTPYLREFCYELRLDSARGDVTSPSYIPPKNLVIYGPHNCTDGDCSDYWSKTK